MTAITPTGYAAPTEPNATRERAIAIGRGLGRYLAAYGVSWGIATTAAPLVATTLLSLGAAGAMWLGCALVATALALAQDRVLAAMRLKGQVT